MPEIDTSIYSKFAPQSVSSLDTAGKALGLASSAQGLQTQGLNNRLLGQQVDSKQALGKAVTAATDPKSGETDWNKALSLLSQDPKGSFAVPELAGQVLDRKLKDLQVQGSDLDLMGKRWEKVGDFAGSMLATKEPLTREQVIKGVTDDLVSSGMFKDPHSVGQLVDFVQTLPEDDKGIRARLNNVALQSKMTSERISSLYAAQNGGLTPSEATAPTPVMVRNADNTLTPSAITRQQFVAATGQGPVATGAPESKIGRTGSETAALVDVYDPATKQMKKVPSGSVVGDTLPAAGGGAGPVPSGPALGEGQQAEANVHQGLQLQQRAAIVPQRRAALANMANTLDGFTPGPKADLTYGLNALATQFGVSAPSQAKGVAAQEEFNKLAAQIALDQWGTLGGTGSNEQLATTVKANPNQAMSKLGIKNVMALLQGNEDAIDAQFTAWQKYKAMHGPATYDQFQQGWNKYYDPRVFQAEHMTPGGVKQMEASMSKAEMDKYRVAKRVAKEAGWIGGK